jgi:hypothetical protein
MRDAALVNQRSKPIIPDLFWELAERWHPASKDRAAGSGRPWELAQRLR